MNDPYIALAKKAISAFIKEKRVLPVPSDLPSEMLQKRAGVFISLHRHSTGELRGCIGTFLPTCKNIAAEIIQNTISASTQDPRFLPIQAKELDDLLVKVDILSSPEPTREEDLDPQKYGLIVKNDKGQTGLLLPDIPGVKTKEDQIRICKEKAFIPEGEPVQLFRFQVERHEETENAIRRNRPSH